MSTRNLDTFHPWPIEGIRNRLLTGATLWELCQSRTTTRKVDTREFSLEHLVRDVLIEALGEQHVMVRKQIGSTLGLPRVKFPTRARPDIVIAMDGKFHICELKSSRIGYSRFDCVFDSASFREYLFKQGHEGTSPWEVEQDLIKLRRFSELTDTVGSCIFLMIDAYAGHGRSWSKVFSDIDVFTNTMRTNLVRQWGEELLASTSIVPIRTAQAEATMIVCEVHSHANSKVRIA